MAIQSYNAISWALLSVLILIGATSLPALTPMSISNVVEKEAFAATVDEQTATDPDCMNKISDEMHAKDSLIDNAKAISLATQNDEVKARSLGYIQTFGSVYTTWELDTTNCHAVQLQAIDVVHFLLYVNGSYSRNIDVAIDPTMTKVLNVTEYVGPHYSSSESTVNWAGYDIAGQSFTYPSLPTTNVWEAVASWTEPSVSRPTDPSTACRTDLHFEPCSLAIWTGLTDSFHGSTNHIAQSGSDAKITCSSSSSCTTSYFLWYEFVGEPSATICSGSSFTAGHGVQAIVTNKAKTGGSSTSYDVSVIDTSTAVGCSTTAHSYLSLSSPVFATFENERPSYNPPLYATLAKFTSNTITGSMYYSSASHGISTPLTNGWYNKIRMVNTVININYGTTSGNTITMTWTSSSHT